MRRRSLLGKSTEYIFSAQTTSQSVSYNSGNVYISIKSTADGENTPYVIYSYDGPVTAVTTAATYVTIRYSKNTSLLSRSGSVVLKQNGSDKTITITITQNEAKLYLYHQAVILNSAKNSIGSTTLSVTESGTVTSKPSWANVTCSNGVINITASAANSATTARTGTTTINIANNSKTITIIQMPNSYASVGGYQYVTINGVKWSIMNVGASTITDYGNYYGYGKGTTTGYIGNDYYNGTENPLASSADTATQVMGGGWRMPTNDELGLLINHSYYWSSYNNINGLAFYDTNTYNCLFFPAAGGIITGTLSDVGTRVHLWSSTPSSIMHKPYHARSFFYEDVDNCYYQYNLTNYENNNAISIRGVHD